MRDQHLNQNPTPSMPPLPDPYDYCYEWDGPFGTRKFSPAPHNGRQCDKSVPLFSTAQMHAYAQAVADARVREAMSGVLEALEAGHDALAAEAKQYHASMAGYRPLVHQALDAEVASVAAVLERVRSLAGKEGTT